MHANIRRNKTVWLPLKVGVDIWETTGFGCWGKDPCARFTGFLTAETTVADSTTWRAKPILGRKKIRLIIELLRLHKVWPIWGDKWQ